MLRCQGGEFIAKHICPMSMKRQNSPNGELRDNVGPDRNALRQWRCEIFRRTTLRKTYANTLGMDALGRTLGGNCFLRVSGRTKHLVSNTIVSDDISYEIPMDVIVRVIIYTKGMG